MDDPNSRLRIQIFELQRTLEVARSRLGLPAPWEEDTPETAAAFAIAEALDLFKERAKKLALIRVLYVVQRGELFVHITPSPARGTIPSMSEGMGIEHPTTRTQLHESAIVRVSVQRRLPTVLIRPINDRCFAHKECVELLEMGRCCAAFELDAPRPPQKEIRRWLRALELRKLPAWRIDLGLDQAALPIIVGKRPR